MQTYSLGVAFLLAKLPAYNTMIPLVVEEMSNNLDKPFLSKTSFIVVATWPYLNHKLCICLVP